MTMQRSKMRARPQIPSDASGAGDRPAERARQFYSQKNRPPVERPLLPRRSSPVGKAPVEEDPDRPGLLAIPERIRDYFSCRLFGLERLLLFVVLPLGLAIALVLALTANAR